MTTEPYKIQIDKLKQTLQEIERYLDSNPKKLNHIQARQLILSALKETN